MFTFLFSPFAWYTTVAGILDYPELWNKLMIHEMKQVVADVARVYEFSPE